MGTPHTSRNQGKILKFHGIERVDLTHFTPFLLRCFGVHELSISVGYA